MAPCLFALLHPQKFGCDWWWCQQKKQREGLWTLLHPLFLWQLPQGRELRVLPPGTQRIQVEVGQGVKKIRKLFWCVILIVVKVPLNPGGFFRCRKEIFLPKATSLKHVEAQKIKKKKTLDLGSKRSRHHLQQFAIYFMFSFWGDELNITVF